MKRLSFSKTHEKVVLAAIILSCGLVMQAEPPAGQGKGKVDTAALQRTQQAHAAVTKAHQVREAKAARLRHQEQSR